MGNRRNTKEQEPLSEFQNTETTGRVDVVDRPYRITEASVKDDICTYAYEVIRGIGAGDAHKVKGSALIKDDLRDALAKFNVHLAVIDDAFKLSKIEVDDIDVMHGHELAFLYTVTGFLVKGFDDNESIVLIGSKHLSSGAGGRMEIKTPKIDISSTSSYKWWNELKAAADEARLEVALYKEGKCTPIKEADEEEEADPNQQLLPFGDADARDLVNEDEFEGAKL
jgi:hypothetical protein